MSAFLHRWRAIELLCVAVSFGADQAVAEQADSRPNIDFFENKIRPVLVERCYRCHSEEKKESKGGLQLDSRDFILKGGKSGAVVVPGEPEKSRLIAAVHRTDSKLPMPPDAKEKLTQAQVQDFVAWVKMGLPFPAAKSPNRAINSIEARKFWSFRPIANPPLPPTSASDWPKDPIDRFILSKLEKNGMKPSPQADERTLLRRATYDLIGLPPTPEEIDAFLGDPSPEAFAKVVDRLLASPQYGVKWGRHWLDVARYGDTRWVGAGEDRRWPFAYTYRDWVVRALNDDMPYDRFVTLQLAADQTPGTNANDQAALGFLTVGRWFTGNLHDVIDDQIDVVTRGLLGITVQCARCHDHKFDPISTEDYYSLYGLFAAARMPVDGTGMLIELPEIGSRPVDAATEKEIAALQSKLDRFLKDRLVAIRAEYRTREKMEQYLLAAEGVFRKKDDDVRALAKTAGLNEHILFRWVRYLQGTIREPHPIFGPFHAFAALPEAEFAAKAGAVAEREIANKNTNRHILPILSPAPTSMADLARRYIELFEKFDAPETSPEFDREMLREVLRNSASPVMVSERELGSYLSKDESGQMLQMRRQTLARLALLSEKADQYLTYQHDAAALVGEVATFLEKRRTTVAAEIRSPEKIAEYLLSAREAQVADDYGFTSIVKSKKLSERLLRRWVAYLKNNADRNDPVFAAWRAFAAPTDAEFAGRAATIAAEILKSPSNRLVADAFEKAPASLRDVGLKYGQLIAKYNSPTAMANPEQEAIRQVSAVPESPLHFTTDEVLDYFTRKDFDELRGKEVNLARLYHESPGTAPRAMILKDSPRSYAQKVFVRGNPNLPGAEAPSRFLTVLSNDNAESFRKNKGRLQVAQAIVDPANPLAARVVVNRVWQWHFGAGLVPTPSDFGTRGTAASHPELLDSLAHQFVAEGWSLKKLHRRIMLSATYRQSSRDNPAYRATDPDNVGLWRMSRRRLTFEETRDSVLFAAGRLDDALGGRPIDLTQSGISRRTIYGAVDRITLPGFYRYFDFPNPESHVPARLETTTSQQALYLMNNAFVMDQARHLAHRAEAMAGRLPQERITALYRLVYGRLPSAEELALGVKFVSMEQKAVVELKPAVPIAAEEPWSYGYGRYSEKRGRVVDFQPFPFFNGQWRGGPQEVDPTVGRASLHSQGGNAGRDGNQAVVRRWTAPRDGTVSIAGKLSVQLGSTQPIGDGVRARLVSSRAGQLGVWLVHGTEEATDFADVNVLRGDTIDFVVDARGSENHGGFSWAPVLRMEGADSGKNSKLIWDAAKDFKGSPPTPKPFGIWDRYAQVLLESNEFFFLD